MDSQTCEIAGGLERHLCVLGVSVAFQRETCGSTGLV